MRPPSSWSGRPCAPPRRHLAQSCSTEGAGPVFQRRRADGLEINRVTACRLFLRPHPNQEHPMVDTANARGVFLVGLKNAHAVEKRALSIMQPQVNRLMHYPDLHQRLEAHISETETQISRLDETFISLNGSGETAKRWNARRQPCSMASKAPKCCSASAAATRQRRSANDRFGELQCSAELSGRGRLRAEHSFRYRNGLACRESESRHSLTFRAARDRTSTKSVDRRVVQSCTQWQQQPLSLRVVIRSSRRDCPACRSGNP